MTIKSVQSSKVDNNKYAKNSNLSKNGSPSFQGIGAPVVTLMDTIERGGFAASFITQDCIGMVAPRIHEGMNRNRDKTGEYNWEFARREGVREILSGPSAFLIPAAMLTVIKKFSGSANDVHIDMIKGFGEHFARYASEHKSTLGDANKAKSEFYEQIFKNVITNSTEQNMSADEVDKLAKSFAEKTLKIEKAKSKGFINTLIGKKVGGSAQDLTQELVDEFMNLRKANVSSSDDFLNASLKYESNNKSVTKNFKTLLSSMKNYTNDALDKTSKAVSKSADTNIADFVKNFNLKRMGTRVATNMSMFLAVVSFYTVIPKLYSMGIKGNPGLKGLNVEQPNAQDETNNDDVKSAKNKPSFTGASGVFSKLGEQVTKSSGLKKFSDFFEFNGASMPVSAMLTLLFGFCLPPRYVQASDNHDRKEILVRDVISFTSILFAAKALARGFSDVFAKVSGFALNIKPSDHDKSLFYKAKNYFTAGSGVNVLNSEEIVSKYSNIDKYKDGINGFFDFVKKNGGDVKKILLINDKVKTNAEEIVGKSIKDASVEEIESAFKNTKGKALDNIYKVFKDSNNQFVKRAKFMNSAFGFASTLLIVPLFMMWLAKFCERMTKKDIEKEKAQKLVENQNSNVVSLASSKIAMTSKKPTMAGFLAK